MTRRWNTTGLYKSDRAASADMVKVPRGAKSAAPDVDPADRCHCGYPFKNSPHLCQPSGATPTKPETKG